MRFNKLLKRFDIRVIDEVPDKDHFRIADNVSKVLSNKFNYIEYGYVFTKLMAAKMYIADFPEGISNVIYSYEEDTLFIRRDEDLRKVSEDLLYECIHAVQDIRNKKGEIRQLRTVFFF